MKEKEVIKVDKKNVRNLRLIFKSGISQDFYRVTRIDFSNDWMVISRLGFSNQLIKEIFRKENVLSYQMDFENTLVITNEDEKDGE